MDRSTWIESRELCYACDTSGKISWHLRDKRGKKPRVEAREARETLRRQERPWDGDALESKEVNYVCTNVEDNNSLD